jgi:hypothetical protein
LTLQKMIKSVNSWESIWRRLAHMVNAGNIKICCTTHTAYT